MDLENFDTDKEKLLNLEVFNLNDKLFNLHNQFSSTKKELLVAYSRIGHYSNVNKSIFKEITSLSANVANLKLKLYLVSISYFVSIIIYSILIYEICK